MKWIKVTTPSNMKWENRLFPFLQFQTLMDVCSQLPHTHLPTLVVSLLSMVLLIAMKELNSFLNPKLPVPIPGELITVSSHHKTHYKTFVEVT